MTPRLLTIILNWRQPIVTLECVRTVQQTSPPNHQILLIDNGSGDDSVPQFQATLPDIPQLNLLCLPTNVGFAAGVNTGLCWAMEQGYEYAFILNNDAFPTAKMFDHLLAEITPDIGLLSPKIFYESEPNRLWFAGADQHPILLEKRNDGRKQLDAPQWAKSRDVDYLLGTGLLVNLAAIEQVGLLDERFFMYYEDLDWSIRFRQAGYRLRLVASAHLLHRVAVSSGGEDSPLRRYYLGRSSIIFFCRHANLGNPLAILLFRFASAVKTSLRLILTRRWATVYAYWRGLGDGWRIAHSPQKRRDNETH